MKVFELINELSNMPAGAEIGVVGWFTDKELIEAVDDVDVEESIVNKRLNFSIECTEKLNSNEIALFITT